MTHERDMPHPPRRPRPATSPRQPGFSSGDRNTQRANPGRDANTREGDEQGWPVFHDGAQRDATPAVPPREEDDRILGPKPE
ncbi:MAG: hypothetical protein HOQ02_04120 [Lysobacter sp.]|nr:hypothetical protein [Lysobacter sp.]